MDQLRTKKSIVYYLQTFYTQNGKHLTINICFYVGFIAVRYLPEDDQYRSNHVGVIKNYVYKCDFNISALFGYIV